uniref:Uncharacterized protein n=1 Tax=Arundo donax TaxID=35708 RepID=A0A0A9AAM4_ARUDO
MLTNSKIPSEISSRCCKKEKKSTALYLHGLQ